MEQERKEKQAIVLKEIAMHGVISRAARRAGVDRRTVFNWRTDDEVFAHNFKEAMRIARA